MLEIIIYSAIIGIIGGGGIAAGAARMFHAPEVQAMGAFRTLGELNACNGGCVGGVLTVENPYVALVKLKHLRKYMPIACNHVESSDSLQGAYWSQDVEYEPVFRLGSNRRESIARMARVEELCERFPGLDCGSCGAPTCKALAEDIVRGEAKEHDCIHILKEYIHRLSGEMSKLDGEAD